MSKSVLSVAIRSTTPPARNPHGRRNTGLGQVVRALRPGQWFNADPAKIGMKNVASLRQTVREIARRLGDRKIRSYSDTSKRIVVIRDK